ncbi:MAG: hypothetical protein S4CHLAM6_09440 [Chlamydiae bacterium]|nr:hypothetical protein [Chlamydiota bacterium]
MVRNMDFKEIMPDVSGWKRINDHYTIKKVEGMPKITVVIPTANSGHLLEITLGSVVRQKNVDKEIIIVDADSEDHTSAIITKYREHISRVYYVTADNTALMINKGFSLATGSYACFLLPGIEYLNQYCLCHISSLAKEDHLPDIIFSGSYLAWPNFENFRDALKRPVDEINPQFVYFPFNKTWLKRGFLPTAPCSIWFKTDYIKKVGGIKQGSKVLRKGLYDLLCGVLRDKNRRVTTSFWSTTFNDRLVEKSYLNPNDFIKTWPITYKHFGLFNAFAWIFRKKPVKFINALAARLSSFFRE